MILPPFSLFRPSSLSEALDAIGEERLPYCGGTELLIAMGAGLQRPDVLVDVKAVPELSGIALKPDCLVIGATTSHADIAAHQIVQQQLPMLAQVEAAVGNARVRAQGSIGGNLCFAEPKSDVATALMALDGTVTVAAQSGRRTVPVADFIVGAYETCRAEEELLIDVRIPLAGRRSAVYCKYQTRERPTVGVALARHDDASYRLVVGAVSDRPTSWTFGALDEIRPDEIGASIEPIPDLTGSEQYLRHITGVFVRRAMQQFMQMEGAQS